MTTGTITWLLTSTTYGTWLPGDARGFVGRVWAERTDDPDAHATRLTHDTVGTPTTATSLACNGPRGHR